LEKGFCRYTNYGRTHRASLLGL